MATWQNPNAGKVLGYIYEYEKQPDTVIDGVPVYKLNKGSDNEQTLLHPNTKPDIVEEGQGFKIFNAGLDNQYTIPISKQPLEKFRSVEGVAGATKIPVYASPFTPSWQGRPMTPEEEFSNAALIAGATGAPVQVSGVGPGVAQSKMFSSDVRQAIGLPDSFDMLRGVDPTKADWGSQKWSLWNPTSKGVIGDFIAESGPFLSIALMLAGIPPVYAGAIAGAANAAANGGNILKGALTGAAVGAVGQGISQGLGSLANTAASTATEAAIDAGIMGGSTASVSSGIASLLSDVSQFTGLSPTIIANAAKGAATAALTGGDPLQGAVAGAATAGVGQTVATSSLLEGLDDNLKRALTTAAQGATSAAVYGGDPLDAALNSIVKTGLGVVEKEFKNAISAQPTTTPSASGFSEPTEETSFAPSVQDIISAAQAGETQQADLASFLQAQEPTPTESTIDSGYLGQEPAETQTFPIAPPDIIPTTPTYDTLEQLLADRGELPVPEAEPTEAQTFPVTPPDIIPTTPSYDTLEQLLADRGELPDVGTEESRGPLEIEIAGTGGYEQPPYSTPTESWIDEGRLMYDPLEIEIAGTGGYEQPTSTPTEDFIDAGGFGGAPYTTPTEEWIDQGGLGGAPYTPPEEGPTGVGATGPTGIGATGPTQPPAPGGGGQAPAPSPAPSPASGSGGITAPRDNFEQLLAMMGLASAMQQRKQPEAPSVVGQITPYQFSTDLLAGLYPPQKYAKGGSINDLLMILRG